MRQLWGFYYTLRLLGFLTLINISLRERERERTAYLKNSCWQNLKLGTHTEVVSFKVVQWTRIAFSATLECVDASPPCYLRRGTDPVSRTCSFLEQATGCFEPDKEPLGWGFRSSGICGCVVVWLSNFQRHHICFSHQEPHPNVTGL